MKNKLSLLEAYPDLCKEWHPTKNDLTPSNFKPYSHKKVWWLGSCGHEWIATIRHRSLNKSRCSFCYGNRTVTEDNCLANRFPFLAKEWHPYKNANSPTSVRFSSGKKAWWICNKCGYEWEISVNHRANGTGCPSCTGHVINQNNCLANMYPEIAKDWHPTLNTTTPSLVFQKSAIKFWWLCPKCKKSYMMTPANRTARNRGCICSRRIQLVSDDNCLVITHPQLSAEWHPLKNGNIGPNNVTKGMTKKYWWLGKCGHEWQATPNSRTKSTGCPICKESHGEKAIKLFLENANIPYKREYKFETCKNILCLPFDFVLYHNKRIKIIEFNGEQHYKTVAFFHTTKHDLVKVQYRDSIKKKWCEDKNVPLLVIPYNRIKSINMIIRDFLEQDNLY